LHIQYLIGSPNTDLHTQDRCYHFLPIPFPMATFSDNVKELILCAYSVALHASYMTSTEVEKARAKKPSERTDFESFRISTVDWTAKKVADLTMLRIQEMFADNDLMTIDEVQPVSSVDVIAYVKQASKEYKVRASYSGFLSTARKRGWFLSQAYAAYMALTETQKASYQETHGSAPPESKIGSVYLSLICDNRSVEPPILQSQGEVASSPSVAAVLPSASSTATSDGKYSVFTKCASALELARVFCSATQLCRPLIP
jgi:hypothetical protein